MALEAIKKIREAEIASEEKRREIVVKTKKIINDAYITAKLSADNVEKDALEKAVLIKRNAETEAEQFIKKVYSDQKLSCDKMKADISDKLDITVNSIVERILSSWQ